jgi:hypothetical protein
MIVNRTKISLSPKPKSTKNTIESPGCRSSAWRTYPYRSIAAMCPVGNIVVANVCFLELKSAMLVYRCSKHFLIMKEDNEAQAKNTLRAIMKLRAKEIAPNLPNTWKDITDVEAAVCDIIWPLYANWLHERLGPCTRNAKFEWSPSTDEPTSVTIYITCETEPETWKCSIVEAETLNAFPETLRSSIHIVIQRGKPHLSCDPSRSDSVQQKDLVLTIEEI